MFTIFDEIPWFLWVFYPFVVIGLTQLIIWFHKSFELVWVEFPWKFRFERRKKAQPAPPDAEIGELDLTPANSTATDERVFPLTISADELKIAEIQYLDKLKSKILDLFARRDVIDLSSRLELPNPEVIDTEFLLHATRHNLNVWIYESANNPTVTRNLHDVAAENELLVILGEPGSGKSWSMYDIALRYILKYESGESHILPLLLSASEWEPSQSPMNFLYGGLKKIISSGLQGHNPSELLLSRFEADLAKGRYVVLIDAINELPKRRLSKIIFESDRKKRIPYSREQSEALRSGFRNVVGDEREWQLNELADKAPEARFIVTCRTLDYEAKTLPWPQAHIQPLDDEQINRFIRSRLSTTPSAIEKMLKELATNKVAKTLAGNPFYLEILITLFLIKRGELPRRRAQLLEELVTLRLKESLSNELQGASSRIELYQNAASKLALSMIYSGYAGARAPMSIVPQKDLSFIQLVNKAGLVTIRAEANGDASIAFYHELIQEYYAAAGLAVKVSRMPIGEMLRDQRWAEVVAMWIELEAEVKTRRRLFKRVLKGLNQKTGFNNTPSLPCSISFIMLLLTPALPCLLAGTIAELLTSPRIILPIFATSPLLSVALAFFVPLITARLWRAWSLDFQTRRNSAHILAALPHPETAPDAVERMVALLNKNDLIRNTPLIEALIELGDFSRVRLRSALYTGRPHARYAAAIALGRLSDAVEAKQISKIFVGDYPDFRSIDENNWRALVKTFWISFKNMTRVFLAGQAIQKSGEFLSEHLARIWKESSNIFEKLASFSLLNMVQGRLPKSVSLGLSLDDSDPNSISSGVLILSRVGDEDSIRQIMKLLHEGKIPESGITQLMAINHPTPREAIPTLVECLSDSHRLTRLIAIRMLGLSSSDSIDAALLPLLDDPDLEIRTATIDALINMKSPKAVELLRKVVQLNSVPADDEEFRYFYMALYALASLGDESVVGDLGHWLEQVDFENLQQRDVIVTQIVLIGYERLKSKASLPWLNKMLSNPNHHTVMAERALDILVAINIPECLTLIQTIPYCYNNTTATKIIEAVKSLGELDLPVAVSILNTYISHEDEDVQRAARDGLVKLSPEAQHRDLVSLMDNENSLPERVQLSILHFTGLKTVDSLIRMYMKVLRKISSLSPTSFTFSANITNQNPILNNLQYFQEYTQFSSDIFTNTTGLQRWGCSMFSFWLPVFLSSLGFLYWLNVPIMILDNLPLSVAWRMWLFVSILITFSCLSLSRMAARIWGIPLIVSLAVGIPLYSALFQTFPIRMYPLYWLLSGILYMLSLLITARFQIENYLPLNVVITIVFLPLLPIVLPAWLVFSLLNYVYQQYHEKWWKPFLDGMLLGYLIDTGLVLMSGRSWIPLWWDKLFWGIVALIVILRILWDKVDFLHGIITKIGRAIGYILSLPTYLIRSWTDKVSGIRLSRVDTGSKMALWWMMAGVYVPLLLWLGQQYSIPAILLIKIIVIAILMYSLSDLPPFGKVKPLQAILSIPHFLLSLPIAIGIALLLFVLTVVIPFLVGTILYIMRLFPWQFTKEGVAWLAREDRLTATSMVTSLGIGGYLAFVFVARIVRISPNETLLVSLPLLLMWIALLLLTIRAYRNEDYVGFSVLLLPVLLPLLPIITIFVVTMLTGFLFAKLIQAQEKASAPAAR
jgi:HEAT repeat protein